MAATAPAPGGGGGATAPRWATFDQHDGAPTITNTIGPGEATLTQGLGGLGSLGEELLEALLLVRLAPADLGRLACASSALRVLCAEEPLWQALALALAAAGAQGGEEPFRYLGSWRATAVHLARKQHRQPDGEECSGKGAGRCRAVPNVPLVDFTRVPSRLQASMHLYRRWYRCNVDTSAFYPPEQGLPTTPAAGMSAADFSSDFDSANKPALLSQLADGWPARTRWLLPELLQRCGDRRFRVSTAHEARLRMTLADYVAYMQRQREEEPLYIFDSNFLESAPMLAEDYSPPSLFRDDFLACLGPKRPDFQWLVIGPPRSGASWHVDPQLTSAWNTLLTGRKRWALYPPHRTPPGVSVTFDEDGEIDIAEPSALRWLLEVYPQLPPEERPLEFVQSAGETVFVPGGWWHMVLNLEATVAVTHNFVSCGNLDRVVEYMAFGERVYFGAAPSPPPGLWCNRPGQLGDGAAEGRPTENKRRRVDICGGRDEPHEVDGSDEAEEEEGEEEEEGARRRGFLKERKLGVWLRMAVERETAPQRAAVEGLALRAARRCCDLELWLSALTAVCELTGRPPPGPLEALPVWGGDSAVFLLGDAPVHRLDVSALDHRDLANLAVVKFFCRGQLEASRDGMACERLAYAAVAAAVESSDDSAALAEALPALLSESGSHGEVSVAWHDEHGVRQERMLPYLVTTRKLGTPISMLRPQLGQSEWASIAAFLGRQLAALHRLPLPHSTFWLDMEDRMTRSGPEVGAQEPALDALWRPFCSFFTARRKHMWRTLTESGLLPKALAEQLGEYIPADCRALVAAPIAGSHPQAGQGARGVVPAGDGVVPPSGRPCWLHGDVTSFNVLLRRDGAAQQGPHMPARLSPSAIVDLGDSGHGDPLYDLVALHVSLFRCNAALLRIFLQEYCKSFRDDGPHVNDNRLAGGQRLPWWLDPTARGLPLSRAATCYLLLHKQELVSGVWKSMRGRSGEGMAGNGTEITLEQVERFLWTPLMDIAPPQ